MSNVLITGANSPYFESLKTLIASIHRTSDDVVDRIYVYNLGLDQDEIKQINTWHKCETIDAKELLKPLPYDDYLLPKNFGFKCLALWNSKNLGDNILWLDAGVMALKSVKPMFDIIESEDFFAVGDTHLNKNYTHDKCAFILNANESEMNDRQLSAGIIGYKKNGIHEHVIDKAFEYSKIRECIVGHENNHRQEQSIFSILVSRFGINKQDIDIYGYWTDLNRNLKTAIENDAVIFVHRRGHYDSSGLLLKNKDVNENKNSTQDNTNINRHKKIKLIDSTLCPYDYLCHHIKPEIPSWYRDIENPDVVVGIAGDGIRQLSNYPNAIKCAWVIEPEIINGEDYKMVVENQDSFDYIFLHDLRFKDRIKSEKFVYLFHGGTHLRQEDIKIHDKTKLVSMIFSHKSWNKYHSFRHEIYPSIKDKVDGYGTGCNRGIKFKAEGLNDYCFSIAMENYDSPGLFTEKILDCILSGTIPIFYGPSDIGLYFNERGILRFENLDQLNDILNNLSFEKYNELKQYALENFEIAKNYIYPEEFIKNFVNNI